MKSVVSPTGWAAWVLLLAGAMACAALLQQAPDKDSTARLLQGFEKAFEGRSLSGLPEELVSCKQSHTGHFLNIELNGTRNR